MLDSYPMGCQSDVQAPLSLVGQDESAGVFADVNCFIEYTPIDFGAMEVVNSAAPRGATPMYEAHDTPHAAYSAVKLAHDALVAVLDLIGTWFEVTLGA